MGSDSEGAGVPVLFHHEELEDVYYTPKKYKILVENYKELTKLLGAYFDDNFFKKLNHQDQMGMVSTIETTYGDQITELLTTHCTETKPLTNEPTPANLTETKPLLTNERTPANFKRIIDRYRTVRPSLGEAYYLNLSKTSTPTIYYYLYNGWGFMHQFGGKLCSKKYVLEEFGNLAYAVRNIFYTVKDSKKLSIICNDIDEDYLYVTVTVQAEHVEFNASYSLDIPIEDSKMFIDIFLSPGLGYNDLFISDDIEGTKRLLSDFNNSPPDDEEANHRDTDADEDEESL